MYGVMIDLAQHEQGHQSNSGTAKREMHKIREKGKEGTKKEEARKKEKRRKEEGRKKEVYYKIE